MHLHSSTALAHYEQISFKRTGPRLICTISRLDQSFNPVANPHVRFWVRTYSSRGTCTGLCLLKPDSRYLPAPPGLELLSPDLMWPVQYLLPPWILEVSSSGKPLMANDDNQPRVLKQVFLQVKTKSPSSQREFEEETDKLHLWAAIALDEVSCHIICTCTLGEDSRKLLARLLTSKTKAGSNRTESHSERRPAQWTWLRRTDGVSQVRISGKCFPLTNILPFEDFARVSDAKQRSSGQHFAPAQALREELQVLSQLMKALSARYTHMAASISDILNKHYPDSQLGVTFYQYAENIREHSLWSVNTGIYLTGPTPPLPAFATEYASYWNSSNRSLSNCPT